MLIMVDVLFNIIWYAAANMLNNNLALEERFNILIIHFVDNLINVYSHQIN